jgi:Domain of unknown function (DUF4159)
MRLLRPGIAIAAVLGVLSLWGVLRAQNEFRQWPAIEYDDFPLPSDYKQPAEWVRARLRYPDVVGYPDHPTVGWKGLGGFPGYWTMDYPRSDRHLLAGVRRLTRIDTRSVEQVASLDGTDDIYNWPTLYGVEVGHWLLPDKEAGQLREYLNRGGFLMVDDFHGDNALDHQRNDGQLINEWETFTDSMNRVLPDRKIEDIPDNDPIFHTIYDLNDRFQVPGAQYFDTGITYEKGPTGMVPHWRCIRDAKGRIVVAICHNMDLGDAWEVSDEPRYPEKWASLAYRIAMNYFIYDLSH